VNLDIVFDIVEREIPDLSRAVRDELEQRRDHAHRSKTTEALASVCEP
jgi:hypothetical protein